MKRVIVLTACLLLLSACSTNVQKESAVQPDLHSSATEDTPENETSRAVKETAQNILATLKSQNWQGFASYVHPENGVRFTPYTYVKIDSDEVLSPSDFTQALSDEAMRNWGVRDGTGEPLILTFGNYYARYIWNYDYTQAPVQTWNEPSARGNILDNARDVYPDAQIVEYHFPGFDPQYEGMDWSSLRLVLEKFNSEWRLVGLIHDEWTI
ncbi:MAG: hypothetical protein PHU04_02490 [Candidatus Peribacteraceae bacterium]|nr:hypothetical protein [Candidatus Peribacteraceae bacterium]